MQQAPWAKKAKEQITIVGPVKRPAMPPLGGAGAPVCIGAIQGRDARFTGYGEDGVLQPDKPTDMVETDQGPKMLHEGEMMLTSKDGRMTVIPANMLPQEVLAKFAESTGTQGYSAGTSDAAAVIDTTDRNQGYVDQALETMSGVVSGTSPVLRTIANRATDTQGARNNWGTMADNITSSLNPNLTPEAKTAQTAMRISNNNSDMATLTGNLAKNAQQLAVDTAPVLATAAEANTTNVTDRSWTDYNAAMKNGDTKRAAEIYKQITGKDMDMTQPNSAYAKSAGVDLVSYAATRPNESWADAQNDPEVKRMLQDRWSREHNNDGTTYDAAWGQARWEEATVSPDKVAIDSMHSSPFYKNAPPATADANGDGLADADGSAVVDGQTVTWHKGDQTQGFMDDMMKIAFQYLNFGNLQKGTNPDGSTYFYTTDAEGKVTVIAGKKTPDVVPDQTPATPWRPAIPATNTTGAAIDANGDHKADADGSFTVNGQTFTYKAGDPMDAVSSAPDGDMPIPSAIADGTPVDANFDHKADADGSYTDPNTGRVISWKAGDPMIPAGTTVTRDATGQIVYDPTHPLNDAQWSSLGASDRIGYFNSSQTNLSADSQVSQANWENAGEPRTYEQYQARMKGQDPSAPLFVTKPDGTLVMNKTKMPNASQVASLELSTDSPGGTSYGTSIGTLATVQYSHAIYTYGPNDSRGNASLAFNSAMTAFITSNKGKVVEISGKRYYIPTGQNGQPAPVTVQLHLQTGHKGESYYSKGVSWGINVPALNVYDISTGKMITLAVGLGDIRAGFHHERSRIEDGKVSADKLMSTTDRSAS